MLAPSPDGSATAKRRNTLRVYAAWTLPHGGMSVSSRVIAGAQFGVGEELHQLADRSLS
jgi:hypothetical protein